MWQSGTTESFDIAENVVLLGGGGGGGGGGGALQPLRPTFSER